MRVTNMMMANTTKRDINENLQKLSKIQEQISSGKKINKASDDPAVLAQSMRLRRNIAESEQYVRNIDEGLSFLDAADTALADLNDVLQRIRELTVGAANGANETSSLVAIREEIETLRGQLQTTANVSYGNKYIFGGTNTTQPPCGETEWIGNGNTMDVEVGKGVTVQVNVDMRDFFGSPTGLDEGGNPDSGIFSVIDQLLDDMTSEDFEAITGNLDIIDTKIDDLLNKQAIVGARFNRLELQQNRYEDQQISLTSWLSKAEDADLAELAVDLAAQENVYTASLSAAAKIIQPSLVDFLS